MAKTVQEYKEHIGYEFRSLLMELGWDGVLDAIIHHEGIDYPDEADRGTIAYDVAEKAASDKYEVEARKAIEALKEYLEDSMAEVTGAMWIMREVEV